MDLKVYYDGGIVEIETSPIIADVRLEIIAIFPEINGYGLRYNWE